MGRMQHAVDSLRLLCTTNPDRARVLASDLGKTNKERQKVVSEVTLHAQNIVLTKKWAGAIVLAHETYHEGVIGLAAGKLAEEYYRPTIVLAKGTEISKASARSISGFNIIEALRKVEDLLEGVGGHPMAAGFSIKTKKLEIFEKRFEEISAPLLSNEVLQRIQKIDLKLDFNLISRELVEKLKKFEPFGVGNPKPTFATYNVEILNSKPVGNEGKHLKMTFKKDNNIFEAIGFGLGKFYESILSRKRVDIVYVVEENVWNGKVELQLNIKDIGF